MTVDGEVSLPDLQFNLNVAAKAQPGLHLTPSSQGAFQLSLRGGFGLGETVPVAQPKPR